jgi:serine/threonine-protein kinase
MKDKKGTNNNSGDVPQRTRDFQLTREGIPSIAELIARLRENYDFFSAMSEREIAWILKLCGRRSYRPGQRIFGQGDIGNCFYVIVYGEVVIRRGDIELSRLGHGDCFGEMAILEEAPRAATAETAKSTLLFSIERDILAETLPSLGFKVTTHLAKELSRKLREADALVEG